MRRSSQVRLVLALLMACTGLILFILAYLGKYSFATFLFLLGVAFISLWWLWGKIQTWRSGSSSSLWAGRLVLISLMFSLTAAELILRHADGAHQCYQEKLGHFHYQSPYAKDHEANFIAKIMNRRKNAWLFTGPKNYQKNRHEEEFTQSVSFNSQGLADREIPLEKAHGELRIIGLGDSFTEGVGAPSDSTWLRALEREIEQAAGKRPATINGGKAGSDPLFSMVLLRDMLLEYGPDLVIGTVNHTDINNVVIRGGMERFQENGTLGYNDAPWWEWLYGSSHIVRYLVHEILDRDSLLLRPETAAARKNAAYDILYDCIVQTHALAQRAGVEFVVVFHPVLTEARSGSWGFDLMIARLRNNTDIPVINLLDYYNSVSRAGGKHPEDYYWPKNGHHTPEGYALFAKGVWQGIRDLPWTKQNLLSNGNDSGSAAKNSVAAPGT